MHYTLTIDSFSSVAKTSLDILGVPYEVEAAGKHWCDRLLVSHKSMSYLEDLRKLLILEGVSDRDFYIITRHRDTSSA